MTLIQKLQFGNYTIEWSQKIIKIKEHAQSKYPFITFLNVTLRVYLQYATMILVI